MRARLLTAIGAALLIGTLVMGVVFAQGGISLETLPGGGWWVSFQVQNVGTDRANLQIEAKSSDLVSPPTLHTMSQTLEKDASFTFIPGRDPDLSPTLPDGFMGSAVLSSDQPIVAVAQVANTPLGNLGVAGGLAGAQYQGFDGSKAATQINFPLVKQNYFGQTTTFNVQAAGSAADVYIVYKLADGSEKRDPPTPGSTIHLDANVMHTFTPSTAGVPEGNTNASLGGATVYSTSGPLAGVVVEHPHAPSGPAQFVLSTRGFAPQDADNIIGAPVIKNNWFGRTTGLQVQNADTMTATVSVAFKGSEGACAGQTYNVTNVSLPAGSSVTFHPAFSNMGGMPTSCFGSAVVTSVGGKIVGTVSESGGSPAKKTIYSAFGKASATKKVALPLVKEEYFNRTTGVAIANLGDALATVTVTYNVQGASPITLTPQTIPSGGSIALFKVNKDPVKYGAPAAGLFGKNSAVVITSDQPVVAIAQESALDGSVDIKNYEGFNLQ